MTKSVANKALTIPHQGALLRSDKEGLGSVGQRWRQCSSSACLVECCFTSTETVGLVGTGAQDGHLNFHTAPELEERARWSTKIQLEPRARKFLRCIALYKSYYYYYFIVLAVFGIFEWLVIKEAFVSEHSVNKYAIKRQDRAFMYVDILIRCFILGWWKSLTLTLFLGLGPGDFYLCCSRAIH